MRRNATTDTTRSAATSRAPHPMRAIHAVLTVTTADSTPELLPSPRAHPRFLPLYECTLSAGLSGRLLGEKAIQVGLSSRAEELVCGLNGAFLNMKLSCDFRPAASSHLRPQPCATLEPVGELELVGSVPLCEEPHLTVEPVVSARQGVAAIARFSYGG